MKIYTKTGDTGETGLFGGPRVQKDHLRIEALGSIDELNADIGVLRAESLPGPIDGLLRQVQNDLFQAGAELATPGQQGAAQQLGAQPATELEAAMDHLDANLVPLKEFILPTGTRACALAHAARGVCRRAERRVVTLRRSDPGSVSDDLLIYVNRLSDLLFVVARALQADVGQTDEVWEKRK
jgi:cob(I)alamin adenosyltransferase